MFSIEPKRQTIVQHSLTITLDESGVKDFLDDATWLQRQVRGIHAQWQRPAPVTRVKRVKRGRPRKTAEKNTEPVKANRSRRGPYSPQAAAPCPHGCGQSIKPSGLKMHERKCPRYQLHKVAAKAQSAVLSD